MRALTILSLARKADALMRAQDHVGRCLSPQLTYLVTLPFGYTRRPAVCINSVPPTCNNLDVQPSTGEAPPAQLMSETDLAVLPLKRSCQRSRRAAERMAMHCEVEQIETG